MYTAVVVIISGLYYVNESMIKFDNLLQLLQLLQAFHLNYYMLL